MSPFFNYWTDTQMRALPFLYRRAKNLILRLDTLHMRSLFDYTSVSSFSEAKIIYCY